MFICKDMQYYVAPRPLTAWVPDDKDHIIYFQKTPNTVLSDYRENIFSRKSQKFPFRPLVGR